MRVEDVQRAGAEPALAAAVSRSFAGTLPSGREVNEFRLRNRLGTEAAILTLGATLRRFVVADACAARQAACGGLRASKTRVRAGCWKC